MSKNKIARGIIAEVLSGAPFTNGFCTISGRTGYNLINAYVVDRPTAESSNNYSIISIYRFSNGDYSIENKEPATFALNLLLIWAKE